MQTTFDYEYPGEPFLITRITDPFSREAVLSYADFSGTLRLESNTDPLNITSTFHYTPSGFLDTLTTPYGTTTFDTGFINDTTKYMRYIQATDPLGGTERAETWAQGGEPTVDFGYAPTVPGYTLDDYYYAGLSLYWDKKAWAMHPGDATKAYATRWLVNANNEISGIPIAEKPALSSATWYAYPGQLNGYTVGASNSPSLIARNIEEPYNGGLDYAAWRFVHYGLYYNTSLAIDPVGRQTKTIYQTNGIVPTARQVFTNGAWQNLESYTYVGTPFDQPDTITTADGQVHTFSYNATTGQLETYTDPLSRTTTLAYETNPAANGYRRLKTITHNPTNAQWSLTYDSKHRIETTTDESNHTLTYAYDSFDRPTSITHLDTTTDSFVYDRLDLHQYTDRLGRITRTWHNALRQPVVELGPDMGVTQYGWCRCGSLSFLSDPNGQITRWTYDVYGRQTKKTYPDGSEWTTSYYPLSGLPELFTDPLGQEKYTYWLEDGSLEVVEYANLAPLTTATPDLEFTYDPEFPRLESVTDFTNFTTEYTYHPLGSLGALQLDEETRTLLPGTTTVLTSHTYDALGRPHTTNIGPTGTENLTTTTFDTLGRLDTLTDRLGLHTLHYVGNSSRIDHIDRPDNLLSSFSYDTVLKDLHLTGITHSHNGTPISSHGYTRDTVGNILTWTTGNLNSTYLYDSVDRLLNAHQQNTTTSATTLLESYHYDPAGNPTSIQQDSHLRTVAYNNLNQPTTTTPGGQLRIIGHTTEPADITINGNPSTPTQDSSNTYSASIPATTGTSTIQVTATDYDTTPTTKTKTWQLNLLGPSSTPNYSFNVNGNRVSDEKASYRYDAENRLTKIVYPSGEADVYSYDHLSRRLNKKYATSFGATTTLATYVWNGSHLAETRDSTGTTILTRYYAMGEEQGTTKLHHLTDHLGSVTHLIDTTGTTRAAYTYSPFGERTKTASPLDTAIGYTSHHHHPTGLIFTQFRAYDPYSHQWLTQDPIGEAGGMNLYEYVLGNPVNYWDPLGLEMKCYKRKDGSIDYGQFTKDLLGEVGKQFAKDIKDPAKNRDAAAGAMASGLSGPAFGAGGRALGRAVGRATGGMKQWLRYGGSYSHNLGQKISSSVRWGASPRYANKIGNAALRRLNQWLRGKRLPPGKRNWRTLIQGTVISKNKHERSIRRRNSARD